MTWILDSIEIVVSEKVETKEIRSEKAKDTQIP